ncbi:MAG: amidohydrolase family protein [Rhodothermia bacterium]|nr:amidohydrolase family protein [Rhodothermia bacterium]
MATVTLCAATNAGAQTTALVGGSVYPVSGPPIENGTVLIAGDTILAVGRDLEVPEGAFVLDVSGKVVTPGFIHANAQVGLIEIGSSTIESRVNDNHVAAGLSLVDAVNPASQLIPVTRAGGVTTVISVPTGGLISGQAIALSLSGESVDDMLVLAPAAIVGRANRSARSYAGGSLAGVFSRLRTLFRDAQQYRDNESEYDANRLRELSASKADLEALLPLFDGELPLLLTANRRSDIEAALRLSEEFEFRLLLRGGKEAWTVAPKLAQAGVAVILDPLENIPTYDGLQTRLDNAAILSSAGVSVSFTVSEEYNPRLLKQQAGNAVAYGMSWDDALRAVTINPAEAFSLDSILGSIEQGKKADLVVWSGEPFELSSYPEMVMIAGQEASIRSRQTLLMERYRDMLSVGGNQ